ncbi:LytR/AlgR family response regulator transcription factor [Lewinella sp. IMCC34191]|uniref:LytR/AlgR family response regulator transcription factor n=1 Tax=Lewinella sp. IMCC34191 TaxID=2259172 RepID=UPI000E24BC1E|nr:LytTR family DNA-binding domain-containing protein [Lewinella sp. IMCC34191]
MLPHSCWILEDEPPAMRRLREILARVSPVTQITFSTDSIAPARAALKERPHPDVIFSDIELADGVSLDLWETVKCSCPIIFTTAYDQYGVRAFRTNGVDYLLKPVTETELVRALDKVSRIRQPSTPDWGALSRMISPPAKNYRQRMLVRYRQDWIPIETDQLRQIYSSDGVTLATGTDGKRYLLDGTLDRLADELDPDLWFRINRGQIVHVRGVRKVTAYFNHRLALELDTEGAGENIVSRQRVKACREWLGN